MAGGQPRGHDSFSRLALARSRNDQVRPKQDHHARHRLAFSERTQKGTESLKATALHLRFAAAVVLLMITAAWAAAAPGRQNDNTVPLSNIGPAPDFTLTNQDGEALSLSALRGKVVAVTFIFTGCGNTCPLLTSKL